MVHAQVSDKYIHFSLMYTTDHVFSVISTGHLVNNYGEPTTTHKLETGMKPPVSNPRFLLCPCIVRKATAHVDTKYLNIRHKSQNKSIHIRWNPII